MYVMDQADRGGPQVHFPPLPKIPCFSQAVNTVIKDNILGIFMINSYVKTSIIPYVIWYNMELCVNV